MRWNQPFSLALTLAALLTGCHLESTYDPTDTAESDPYIFHLRDLLVMEIQVSRAGSSAETEMELVLESFCFEREGAEMTLYSSLTPPTMEDLGALAQEGKAPEGMRLEDTLSIRGDDRYIFYVPIRELGLPLDRLYVTLLHSGGQVDGIVQATVMEHCVSCALAPRLLEVTDALE